tara:strand:+ start:437 stop:565 length:129 start_codon:yes stop_codon:yes gene_type:complete
MAIARYITNVLTPIYPGIVRPLSKQGLDAIIGKEINSNPGAY